MNQHENNGPEQEMPGNGGAEQSLNPGETAAKHGADSGADERATEAVAQAECEDDETRLRNELADALAELDRHREAMLRMQADTENQRKRMVREMEKSRRFALERIMKDLLQVRDSLERGLDVDPASATVDGLLEGGKLTLKLLSKVMQDHGLEVIDPTGEPFDPEWHEAMTMAPTADHDENTVIEVLQKGFKLNDRLIRPAMVVVSRKPDE